LLIADLHVEYDFFLIQRLVAKVKQVERERDRGREGLISLISANGLRCFAVLDSLATSMTM